MMEHLLSLILFLPLAGMLLLLLIPLSGRLWCVYGPTEFCWPGS